MDLNQTLDGYEGLGESLYKQIEAGFFLCSCCEQNFNPEHLKLCRKSRSRFELRFKTNVIK